MTPGEECWAIRQPWTRGFPFEPLFVPGGTNEDDIEPAQIVLLQPRIGFRRVLFALAWTCSLRSIELGEPPARNRFDIVRSRKGPLMPAQIWFGKRAI